MAEGNGEKTVRVLLKISTGVRSPLMPLITNAPPPTPVDLVTEVLHGVSVADPYRWLEDRNSMQTHNWLDEQTTYARAYLDAIPGRERIRSRIEELLSVEVVTSVSHRRNRYFFLKRRAKEEQAAIVMREGESQKDITLVDPSVPGQPSSISPNPPAISRAPQIPSPRI